MHQLVNKSNLDESVMFPRRYSPISAASCYMYDDQGIGVGFTILCNFLLSLQFCPG